MSATIPAMPRGFLAWIPFLWSRVLFPVPSAEPTKLRWSSLVCVLVLPAALLYPTRAFRLLEPDEGRYAEIAREMYLHDEWVVPVLQGQPYLDKPPLVYWLVEIAYALLGVSDAAARAIPAMAVHGTILLIYLLGRRSLGERSAFWGALLLAVAPGFLGMGRLLILDGVLTFWVTLSLLAGFEAIRGTRQLSQPAARAAHPDRWWLLAALACGLGILTKGPVALLLLFPPLVAYRILIDQKIGIGWRTIAKFLLVVAIVNLPWYAAIYRREPLFLKHFFWEHNVMRFLQPFDHLQPIWYYTPILLAGFLPGSLLFWVFGRFLCSGDETIAVQRTRELGFWLLAGGWCIFFFSLSGSKLPTYILPAFPCLALGLGDFIARSRWNRSLRTKAGIGGMAVILGAATYIIVPWYAQQRSPMNNPELIAHYCGGDAPVFCFPRNCDSISFYLGRDDFRNVRTKASQELVEAMMVRPRTVVLFTHRHSLETLKMVLPPQLRIVETASLRKHGGAAGWLDRLSGDSPWGLCDLAIIERIP